jgi:redox-sensitive bicupin YhaK (pirin superfamily)
MTSQTPQQRSSSARSIQAAGPLAVNSPGGGFDEAVSLSERALGVSVLPFVDLTVFRMSQPVFRPHPHAGFSAVTYMFEDSPGTFINRWSKGDSKLIGPGSLHWTQAGIGMMHEEIPTEPGVSCHGLQMFVKLAGADELSPPEAFHLDHEEVVEITDQLGARIRLLAGSAFGQHAGIGIRNELVFLEVHLKSGTTVELPAPARENTFVFIQSGTLNIGDREFGKGDAAVFAHDGDHVSTAASTPTSLLFGSGVPLNEPVFAQGPFMMSSRERLSDAGVAFQRGDMGHLEPSF